MGLALCWKPKGVLSQKFLGNVKSHLKLSGKGRRGIGHSGTLDPFATGVLCVGWGEGTKLLSPLTNLPKLYKASMLLGVFSETLDIEGSQMEVHSQDQLRNIENKSEEFFQNFLNSKLGSSLQVPPQFSAVRVNGKRAYELARKSTYAELAPREINVLFARHISLEKQNFRGSEVLKWDFEVMVSSGCYIRAFARDWSEELIGRASCLQDLMRLQIGPFKMGLENGDPLEGPLIRRIGLNELQEFFEIYELGAHEEEKLEKGGHWVAKESSKPMLLLGKSGKIKAWCKAENGQLGRVFNADPL